MSAMPGNDFPIDMNNPWPDLPITALSFKEAATLDSPENDFPIDMRDQWPDLETTDSSFKEAAIIDPSEGGTTQKSIEASVSSLQSSCESQACCLCGKEAQLSCAGCKGCPTGHLEEKTYTRYCSAICQKAHWKAHKADCKAAKNRRLLYRSAQMTKALFYAQLRVSFTWGYFQKVEKVDVEPALRIVIMDRLRTDFRKKMLIPFSMVTELVSDPRDQEAFLTHESCNFAVGIYGPMLVGMLKGAVRSIEEITLIPKDLKVEIVIGMIDDDNQPFLHKESECHNIFRVTMRNGERYAVDLSGAQYGYQQECVAWKEYASTRIQRVVGSYPFGDTTGMLKNHAMKTGNPFKNVYDMNVFFAEQMSFIVTTIGASQENSVDAILALPEKSYDEKRGMLVDLVERLMELIREESIRQGSWCRK